MHSKEGRMKDFFNENAEEEDNLEKFEEIKSATLGSESSSNQFSFLKKSQGGLGGIKEFSTVGTQTPLTWIKCTLMQLSSDKCFIDSTTPSAHFSNQESMYVEKDEKNVKSFSCNLTRNQMSITLNDEVAAQSMLMHSGPRASRDILQISTSFSSNKSNPRNEILTVITNYDNSSPDAPSISEDAIEQDDNGGLDLDEQDTYEPSHMVDLALPNAELPRNNVFTRRTDHRPWSIMRLLNNHFRCMSTVNDEPDTTRPYMGEEPPTYSTIYATHGTRTNNWRFFRSTNESSFIAPIPPPSYAQTQGICLASYSMDHLLPVSPNTSRQWSSRPTTAVCPRCTIIVVTTVQVRHSINTHATAIALFLCGCWPCCLIPYCLNTCKTIDHYCPICRAYLGTYRPC